MNHTVKGHLMQLRKLALVIGLAGMFFVNFAHALGLGEITLKSSLNEPLNAEIKLLQTGGLSENEILVSLASSEAFERIGIERLYFLSDIRFKVDARRRVIKLTTRKPVTEPYLNFLIEVQWPSGRLLREYTLLMDIPGLAEKRKPAPVAAPRVTSTKTKTRSTQPVKTRSRTPVDSYTVRSGDTLWEIASRVRPSNQVTVYQTMMALQRARS